MLKCTSDNDYIFWGRFFLKSKRLNLVQLVRALAIIFVLIGHLNSLFYAQFSYDWFDMGVWGRTGGVDLFFVISGFMITYLYSRYIGDAKKAQTFFKKRILRIVPLYWIVTIGAASLFYIFPQLGEEKDRSIINTIESLFFINPDPTLIVAWSLSHIILFYLLFSLLIMKPKIMKIVLSLWFASSILLQMFNLHSTSRLTEFLFGINNLEIWVGALVAYLIKNHTIKYEKSLFAFGVLLFLAVWSNNFNHFIHIEMPIFYCIASFLVLLSIVSFDLKKTIKIPSSLTYIGNSSYSIYLIHGPFLQFYILIFKKIGIIDMLGYNLSMLIITLITIITGTLVYRFLENPLNQFLTGKLIKEKKIKNKIVSAKIS